MNNWKIIPTIVFATVLIFGAGVMTGGVLVNYVKKNEHRSTPPHHPAPAQTNSLSLSNAPIAPMTTAAATNRTVRPPEILSTDFLRDLDGKLQLTKDQHEAAQKIITDGQNLIRKVVQDARLEIRDILTPAQQEQFDELVKRPFRKPLFGTNAPPSATQAAPVTHTNEVKSAQP